MKSVALIVLFPCFLAMGEPAEIGSREGRNGRPQPVENPNLDGAGSTGTAVDLSKIGNRSSVTEDQFIALMSQPDTVVLDARVRSAFDNLRVKGALHLDIRECDAESIKKLIPDKGTRILVYCSDNFKAPGTFEAFLACVSVTRQITARLGQLGYTNFNPLEPTLEVGKTKLVLEGPGVKVPMNGLIRK